LVKQEHEAQERILVFLELLRDKGISLREPHCKHLGGGVYELRPIFNNVHYRIMYFFNGMEIVIVTSGFKKKTRKTPKSEIEKVKDAIKKVKDNPDLYTTE
jgi:phage-related protein